MKLINKLTGKKIQLVKIQSSFRTSKSHYDLLTFDEEIQLELYGACETVLAINTEDRLKPMPSNMTISEWVKANSYSLKSTDIEIVLNDFSNFDSEIFIKLNRTSDHGSTFTILNESNVKIMHGVCNKNFLSFLTDNWKLLEFQTSSNGYNHSALSQKSIKLSEVKPYILEADILI